MFHFTVSIYGRSAKQCEMIVEYSSFSSEYSCQNMSYTLASKTSLGYIKYLKLISNKKWNLQVMIEIKKIHKWLFWNMLPLDLKIMKNGWRWIWISSVWNQNTAVTERANLTPYEIWQPTTQTTHFRKGIWTTDVTYLIPKGKKSILQNSVALVCERTIPTERPLPVSEVSANFCG